MMKTSKDQLVSLITKRINVPCSIFVLLAPISLIPMLLLCLYTYNNLSITPSPQTHILPHSNSIAITCTCSPFPPPHSPPPPSLPPPPPYSLSLPPPLPLSPPPSLPSPPTQGPPSPSPPSPPPSLPSPPTQGPPSPSPSPPPPSLPSPPTQEITSSCDYSDGKWVRDKRQPLYNNTTCGEIKSSQNCMANGRPDSEYLYWRWRPIQCHLPRFEPHTFLQLIRNKLVAIVGDSVAKNQFDSLICMLLTASSNPTRIDFYKWHFPSHNASLFFYWSPFLVKGVQRVSHLGPNYYNTMHLDRVKEKWARDVHKMDLIVLSIGHWLSDVPSIYYENGTVFGCRNCPNLNCTNINFYVPLRKALRVALNTIIERKVNRGDGIIDVIVRTFSPSHFEGSWDKGGTCSRTRPRRKGKRFRLEGMNAEIRRIQIEEVEIAKAKAKQFGGFRFEVMDVTKLALLRPDGHPGAYREPFPFAKGVPNFVQNDCVHWCLPGPIDTWNEIFVQMIKILVERPRS